MHQVSTPKSTMWSKQLKRRKSYNAMVMSLTPRTKNVRKKSKQWQQPCCTWRRGTKITVTSLCKALRVLISNASRSSRTSAVQSVKICLKNVVICSRCRRISMLHRESWWMSKQRRTKLRKKANRSAKVMKLWIKTWTFLDRGLVA